MSTRRLVELEQDNDVLIFGLVPLCCEPQPRITKDRLSHWQVIPFFNIDAGMLPSLQGESVSSSLRLLKTACCNSSALSLTLTIRAHPYANTIDPWGETGSYS